MMDVVVNKEQEHMIRVAINSAMEPLYQSGNVFPTVFVHDGDKVRYFSFEVGTVESLRQRVKDTIAEKCGEALAYAFVYDSTLEEDGAEIDALVVESGSRTEAEATGFAIRYDREKRTHGERELIGPMENLLMV